MLTGIRKVIKLAFIADLELSSPCFFEAVIFLLSRIYNMDLAFVPHIRYGRYEDGLKSQKNDKRWFERNALLFNSLILPRDGKIT